MRCPRCGYEVSFIETKEPQIIDMEVPEIIDMEVFVRQRRGQVNLDTDPQKLVEEYEKAKRYLGVG